MLVVIISFLLLDLLEDFLVLVLVLLGNVYYVVIPLLLFDVVIC